MVFEGKTWRKGVMFIAFEPVMNMIQSITAFKLSSMFYKSLYYVHWWIFLFPLFYNFKAFENNCMLPLGSSIKKQSWCLYLTTLIILNFIIDPDVFSCCHRPARNTNIQILPNSKLSLKKKKKIRSCPIIAWVIESISVYQFYFSYFATKF